MKTNVNSIQSGSFTVQVPEGCPQPDIFKAVITELLAEQFEQPEHAAQCQAAFQTIRDIPEPFASNREAAYHYRRAMLELNPQAKRWDAFQNAAFEAFLDYDEEGADRQEPIPGWTPSCGADIEITL